MATPRNEAETIISYDYELDQWHYYSDVPKHNRKWDKAIIATRREVDENGTIVLLKGTIDGNVSVRKHRELSEEQRKAMSDRLKLARINSKAETTD